MHIRFHLAHSYLNSELFEATSFSTVDNFFQALNCCRDSSRVGGTSLTRHSTKTWPIEASSKSQQLENKTKTKNQDELTRDRKKQMWAGHKYLFMHHIHSPIPNVHLCEKSKLLRGNQRLLKIQNTCVTSQFSQAGSYKHIQLCQDHQWPVPEHRYSIY